MRTPRQNRRQKDRGRPEPTHLRESLKNAFVHRIPDHTRARHLAAMAETAAQETTRGVAIMERGKSTTTGQGPTLDRGRPSSWVDRGARAAARLAVATVVALGSTVGLAYAGFDLPGVKPARALERVLGLDLPNQDGSVDEGIPVSTAGADEGEDQDARNDHGEDVSAVASDPDKETGCAFGQSVSDVASSKSKGKGHSADKPSPCDKDKEAKDDDDEDGDDEGEAKGHSKGKANGNANGHSKPHDDDDDADDDADEGEGNAKGHSKGKANGNANGHSKPHDDDADGEAGKSGSAGKSEGKGKADDADDDDDEDEDEDGPLASLEAS